MHDLLSETVIASTERSQRLSGRKGGRKGDMTRDMPRDLTETTHTHTAMPSHESVLSLNGDQAARGPRTSCSGSPRSPPAPFHLPSLSLPTHSLTSSSLYLPTHSTPTPKVVMQTYTHQFAHIRFHARALLCDPIHTSATVCVCVCVYVCVCVCVCMTADLPGAVDRHHWTHTMPSMSRFLGVRITHRQTQTDTAKPQVKCH